MRSILVILCCSLVMVGVEAQQSQAAEARPTFDVPSLVLQSDNMRFVVFRPKGKAANGTPLYEKIVVRDSRREDFWVAAQKLRVGRLVPQGARGLALGTPMVEFYVGDNQVLRVVTFLDRLICSTKDASVDLLFGEQGVQELKDLFDRFTKANQSLEPTTMLGTSAAEQPLVPSIVVAHL